MPPPQGAAPQCRAEQAWHGADLGVEPDPTTVLLGATARLFPSREVRHSGCTKMGLLSITPELFWSHVWLLPILFILGYASVKPLLKQDCGDASKMLLLNLKCGEECFDKMYWFDICVAGHHCYLLQSLMPEPGGRVLYWKTDSLLGVLFPVISGLVLGSFAPLPWDSIHF